MYMLVTYDVQTTTPSGKRRLRRLARACLDYGQRVQFSVFELKVDPSQWATCRDRLLSIFDPEKDSLRSTTWVRSGRTASNIMARSPAMTWMGP